MRAIELYYVTGDERTPHYRYFRRVDDAHAVLGTLLNDGVVKWSDYNTNCSVGLVDGLEPDEITLEDGS